MDDEAARKTGRADPGIPAESGGRRHRHSARGGILTGLAVVGVLTVAAVLWVGPPRRAREEGPAMEQVAALTPAEAPRPAAPEPEAPAPAALPALDLVRVNADGTALVAGRGRPGARIIVLIDGNEAMPIRADARGQFATFVALGEGPRARVLRLRMQGDDGSDVLGAEEVVIARPAPPTGTGTDPAPVTGESAVARAVTAPVASAAPVPASRAAAPPPAEPPGSTAAPRALALGPEGPRVMAPVKGVSIDSLAYDEGGIRLGGRAEGQGTVRLYVDGVHAGDAEVAGDGSWHLPLAGLAPGVHNARADRLDAEGQVSARVDLPFAADPVAMAATVEGPATVATVQPGESLWRIAERRYGAGALYVRLFEANRAQILDPDLIYPGQIFALPD